MKNFHIFLLVSISTLSINTINLFSQDVEKYFLEFPDELFAIQGAENDHFFKKEVRETCLQSEYFASKFSMYSLDEAALNQKINKEYLEELEENNIVIKVDKKANHLNTEYWSENAVVIIDFFVLPSKIEGEKNIIIIQQYPGIMGNPSIKEISRFSFNEKSKEYKKQKIQLPEYSWNDFYSTEDIKKLNTELLEDVEIPIENYVLCINQNSFLLSEPDISEFVGKFIGTMDHVFEYEPNEMEDMEMTKDSLGFNDVEDATPTIHSMPNYEKIKADEFYLMRYFDFFLEDRFNDYKPYVVRFSEDKSDWEINAGQEKASFEFKNGKLDVSSEMMNKDTYTIAKLGSGFKSYLLIIHNSSGLLSKSEIFVYQLNYSREVKDYIQTIKPEWFGIKSDKNVFVELKDYFAPKYEFENGELRVSLLVNPTMGNAAAESINNQSLDQEKTIIFVWEKDMFVLKK